MVIKTKSGCYEKISWNLDGKVLFFMKNKSHVHALFTCLYLSYHVIFVLSSRYSLLKFFTVVVPLWSCFLEPKMLQCMQNKTPRSNRRDWTRWTSGGWTYMGEV